MAYSGIDALRQHFPSHFDDLPLPTDWDDWLVLPAEEAQNDLIEMSLSNALDEEDLELSDRIVPEVGDLFPGSPDPGGENGATSDTLAFYLPFHFYPRDWGVYITIEGWLKLAREIRQGLPTTSGSTYRTPAPASAYDLLHASHDFLLRHERFHHQVEAWATRLEVAHRAPFYKQGVVPVYRRTLGTNACVEEALANAHGYRQVRRDLRRQDKAATRRWSGYLLPPQLEATVLPPLEAFIRNSPPGYNQAMQYEANAAFEQGRYDYAEDLYQQMFRPAAPPEVWSAFDSGFKDLPAVRRRTYYIVHINAPIVSRIRLLHRLKARKFKKKLRERGCRKDGEGAKHERWVGPNGDRFPMSRNVDDMSNDLMKRILKEAGIDEPLSVFLTSRA